MCKGNSYKNECFEIFDENESKLHDWFFRTDRQSFLEQFCFKQLGSCSQKLLDDAATKEVTRKVQEAAEKAKSELAQAEKAKSESAQAEKAKSESAQAKLDAAGESLEEAVKNKILMHPEGGEAVDHMVDLLKKKTADEAAAASECSSGRCDGMSLSTFVKIAASLALFTAFFVYNLFLRERPAVVPVRVHRKGSKAL